MIGDLHTHTRYSDGSHSPRELVVHAAERGLGFLGITDHDTTAGTAEAVAIGRKLGVAVVPAVEISAFDFERERKVHVLGYNYRLPADRIEQLCRPLRIARHENTMRQIKEVQAAGFKITKEQVVAHATGRTSAGAVIHEGEVCIYKQHIMLALIDAGYTDEIYGELYRNLFKGDGPAAYDIDYVDVREAIAAIRADGGRAVIAHPGQLDSFELCEQLAQAGEIDGIELYHPDHGSRDHARVRELCTRYGLIATGGSDFHGEYGSPYELAGVTCPHGAFERITAHRDEQVAALEDLIRQAGAMARAAVAATNEVTTKGDNFRDLVTQHDVAIEKRLIAELSARFPSDGFYTEEGDHAERSGRVWIIDPIDGTTNFIAQRRGFAISVALYEDGTPRFGCVYDVMEDRLFTGVAGEGAWLNGVALPMREAGPPALSESLLDCSLNSAQELAEEPGTTVAPLATATRAQRAIGSAALAVCAVADGTRDVYIASSVALWDYAAAAIILLEAGGALYVHDRGSERVVLLALSHPGQLPEISELVFPSFSLTEFH